VKVLLLSILFFNLFFSQQLNDYDFSKYLYNNEEYELALIPLHYQMKLSQSDTIYKYILKSYDHLNAFNEAENFILMTKNDQDHLLYFQSKQLSKNLNVNYSKLSSNFKIYYDSYTQLISSKKPPLFYALSSAILPGSGKMLNGQFSDGFTALSINTLFAFLTNRSFQESGSKSISPYIYGSFFLYFYTSNIYGTYVSIKVEEKRMLIEKRKNISLSIKLDF
jgi:TM2 domain-containing membrane protein YozV